ncbi:methyl-accepting chemotaxis protein, partial [Methylobacterium sp. E-066]|nr:methyl-accepting chemotaxis protein [Methylobacterium sp. E-066]
STEEASASVEEMAANVKQNAENASQTEAIARQSAKDAEASGIAAGQAGEAMQTIPQKTTILPGIPRQAYLLAVNAAVDAGRADEHCRGGRGVPLDVRKLARCTEAGPAHLAHVP